LIILSPLGLIIPELFRAGSAWGEWSSQDLKEMLGYIPKGLEKLTGIWRAPIPDYVFKGWEGKGLPVLGFAYIFSAVIGISVIVISVYLLARFMAKDNGHHEKK